MATLPAAQVKSLSRALPFWISLCGPVAVVIATLQGGLWLLLPPLLGWWIFTAIDALVGETEENPDPQTPEADLHWYRAITLAWFPLQFAVLIWMLVYVPNAAHLTLLHKFAAFLGLGVISGTIGITYAHELMHQKNRLERALGDLLMASVLYSHFRSEHLRVHHTYVCTPRDPVTARYNEGFHRFFPRVLVQSARSSWMAEAAMLARRGLSPFHSSNPFWVYGALQLGFAALAYGMGGGLGLGLFAFQAYVAIWQLELINYIEHYGLTRRHLGDGKYEHVMPHHSWNSAQKASNWLLINLQRHSDHHYKPDRRFPLLQTYGPDRAPALPYGYPVMTLAALVPPLWKRIMNPRVRAWRAQHYPDITDWHAYNKALNPGPK